MTLCFGNGSGESTPTAPHAAVVRRDFLPTFSRYSHLPGPSRPSRVTTGRVDAPNHLAHARTTPSPDYSRCVQGPSSLLGELCTILAYLSALKHYLSNGMHLLD